MRLWTLHDRRNENARGQAPGVLVTKLVSAFRFSDAPLHRFAQSLMRLSVSDIVP